MSRPTHSDRNIVVAAMSDEDKNAFTGSLMYRLGLDAAAMDQLQKAEKTKHTDVVPFMRAAGMDTTFHLPHHACRLVDDASVADVLVLVVNAGRPREDARSTLHQLETRRAVERESDVVVVIDHMHDIGWDLQEYLGLVDAVECAFEREYKKPLKAHFVPISSAGGDNFLENSDKSPWYTRDSASPGIIDRPLTVADAIDS